MAREIRENRVNVAKSVQMTFNTRREICPSIILNGLKIPQAEDAKYLRLHFVEQTGRNTYSSSGNNMEFNSTKCTGCSAGNRNYR